MARSNAQNANSESGLDIEFVHCQMQSIRDLGPLPDNVSVNFSKFQH